MGELHTDIEWEDGTTNTVNIVPDVQQWLDAAQIPLNVIVGLNDTSPIQEELLPGQKGSNRLTIARNWIKDMNAFAELHGVTSAFTIGMIPGIGHSMIGLLPYSQKALLSK